MFDTTKLNKMISYLLYFCICTRYTEEIIQVSHSLRESYEFITDTLGIDVNDLMEGNKEVWGIETADEVYDQIKHFIKYEKYCRMYLPARKKYIRKIKKYSKHVKRSDKRYELTIMKTNSNGTFVNQYDEYGDSF